MKKIFIILIIISIAAVYAFFIEPQRLIVTTVEIKSDAFADILEEQLRKCGAEVSKGFKVDGEVAPVKDDAVNCVLGLTK